MSRDTSYVRRVVIEETRRILRSTDYEIGGGERFVRDLGIDSDDLSFELIPRLERHFGVRIVPAAWRKVFTVNDAVQLLLNAQTVGERSQSSERVSGAHYFWIVTCGVVGVAGSVVLSLGTRFAGRGLVAGIVVVAGVGCVWALSRCLWPEREK